MSKPPTVHLSELTFEEAAALRDRSPVAFLPTGATEAHGPHLPLSTDVIISTAGAERAAQRLRDEGRAAAVLPPLAYAVTEFAADFAGTLSIPLATARLVVRDVILAAHRAGFVGVVICNAHLEPGNIVALREGLALANELGAHAVFPDVTRKPHALRLGEEFRSGACHAGRYETSLVMAAAPFMVRRERANALAPNPNSLSVAIREGKGTFAEAGGPEAYFGWPADASDAEGGELLEVMADIFATAAAEIPSPEER